MNLFSESGESSFDRLLRSLSGAVGSRVSKQRSAMTEDQVQRLFGSEEDFLNRYKNFEDEFFRLLGEKDNRSVKGRNLDINLERNSGRIDLSNLTYRKQQEMKEIFMRNVLRMEEVLQEVGVPNIEFPSGNLYRSLLKFDTGTFTHPAVTLLNRMMFNIDPSKEGLKAFDFGGSSILQTDILRNISSDFEPGVGKKILTFDTETTGVMQDSQVRQFAYQLEEVSGDGKRILLDPITQMRATDLGDSAMKVASFRNPQMNLARASISGQSMPLSDFVSQLEGRANIEMGEGGINFVNEAKTMLTAMLNADHVSGHNVLFDVDMMGRTLESLDAFHADSEAKTLLGNVYQRIKTTENYLIDTQETIRSYFYKKAAEKFEADPEKASKFVSQLLGPETMANIGIGGSTAPVSVENLALNSNIFQLIEQEDQELAQQMTKRLKEGSHIADTDVALQASLDRYRRAGKLDFRFDVGGTPIGEPLSDFERFARNQVFKSGAINPTTNVASLRHMSDAVFAYSTSEQGLQRVKLTAKASALGLSDDAEGILSFSRSQDAFTFRRFGSDTAEIIDSATAKSHLTRTLNQARVEGEGVSSQIRVGTSFVNVTRNLADEQIISLGYNYIQSTGIDETVRAASVTSGIANVGLSDQSTFIRALGLTSEQFGQGRSYRKVFDAITGKSEMVDPVRNPLEMSREAIDSYYRNAARAGLPFAKLNVADRVTSVGIAQATAKIAESAPSVAYARNASLLSEMGLSFFKMQNVARLGSISSTGDLNPSSRVMLPFAQIFDVGTSTVADNAATTSLGLKAFQTASGDTADIMSTNLNRFTLSYVSGSGETGEKMTARVNLVWGANGTLGSDESEKLAKFALDNQEQFRDLISQMDNVDVSTDMAKKELLTTGQKYATYKEGSDEQKRIVTQLAEHIRERGVIMGYAEGESAEGVRTALLRSGIDITGNDVRVANSAMRLVHADMENGLMVMSAVSDTIVDEATGRTAEVAQQEAREAFKSYQTANNILNESGNRRRAQRVIRGARAASADDLPVDLDMAPRRDFTMSMTDFYVANKKRIGIGSLGLAVAGVGYYMYNKRKQQDVYNETMAYMPTEPVSNKTRREVEPTPLAQSTRRDPLVTAGVVGNLDRNKINHSKMGPRKYDHLYGG